MFEHSIIILTNYIVKPKVAGLIIYHNSYLMVWWQLKRHLSLQLCAAEYCSCEIMVLCALKALPSSQSCAGGLAVHTESWTWSPLLWLAIIDLMVLVTPPISLSCKLHSLKHTHTNDHAGHFSPQSRSRQPSADGLTRWWRSRQLQSTRAWLLAPDGQQVASGEIEDFMLCETQQRCSGWAPGVVRVSGLYPVEETVVWFGSHVAHGSIIHGRSPWGSQVS